MKNTKKRAVQESGQGMCSLVTLCDEFDELWACHHFFFDSLLAVAEITPDLDECFVEGMRYQVHLLKTKLARFDEQLANLYRDKSSH